MKKSIFDLTFKEGVELDLEIRKTSYYKQYLKGYILIICFLVLLGAGFIGYLSFDDTISSSLKVISMIILLGFTSLICLNFWFKRFDLMKIYFDEKK